MNLFVARDKFYNMSCYSWLYKTPTVLKSVTIKFTVLSTALPLQLFYKLKIASTISSLSFSAILRTKCNFALCY